MAYDIGSFDTLVELKTPVEAKTAEGQPIREYTPYRRFYAMKTDVSGKDYYEAAAALHQSVVTYTIEYDSAVDETMILTDGGCDYRIDMINHLGYKGDFMQLKCLKITSQ